MISVEHAQELILAGIAPGPTEQLDLLSARGRVLAETVLARSDFPAFDNSAMDGYAVRSSDAERTSLTVVEVIAAGQVPEKPLNPGQCARIMTGAMLPVGADAVLIQEQVRAEGETIHFERLPVAGTHVRRRGEFQRAGSPLLTQGAAIGPGEVALLAAARRSFVQVHRAPVVAILSTGDELVAIDGDPAVGQLADANQYGLAAQVAEAGGIPRLLGIAPDDPEQLTSVLDAALAADFVLTSGGASVGQFDRMPEVLRALGAEVILHRINMKPGKPLIFASRDRCRLWGLPGNPVSSLLCFWQFVRPAIRRWLGYPAQAWFLPTYRAVLATPLRAGDRRSYFRGQLRQAGEGWQFEPARTDKSGDLTSLAGINGFAWLESGNAAAAGDTVCVLAVGAPRSS